MGKIKITIILIIVLVLAVVGYGVYVSIRDKNKTAGLEIEAVPTGVKILLNDKSIRNGKNKLGPGSYTITVSHEGFETQEISFSIQSGQQKYYGFVLISNSALTENWYAEHPGDRAVAEGISSKEFDISTEQATKNVPLISELPYLGAGLEFRIDYGAPAPDKADNQPTIYITTNTVAGKQDALNWIRKKGYDPNSLSIVYVDKTPQ